MASIAALAAVWLAVLALRGRGPDTEPWAPLAASAVADVQVGGHPVAASRELARRLQDWDAAAAADGTVLVETGGTPLRLELAGELVLELGPSTRAWIPRPVCDADLLVRLESGAVRVATGPEFRTGRPERIVAVATPHLTARAVGTVFGVDSDASLTCVCCLEGEVAVQANDDPAAIASVRAGASHVRHADGRTLEHGLPPEHAAPLVELRALRPSPV